VFALAAQMRAIWDRYFSECDGVIYVVDAADKARFEEAATVLSECF
jgi:hypothetical protein